MVRGAVVPGGKVCRSFLQPLQVPRLRSTMLVEETHITASRGGARCRKQAGRSDFVRAVGVSIIRAAGLRACGTDDASNAVNRVMRRRERQ